ncbi:MAG: Tetracycline resistance protein, class C [Calditrichaeota bacterium]|nr:Tetracycline resistance protein, class C [Calditrichota bacterium]
MSGRPRLRHIVIAEFLFLIGFAMMIPLLPLYARGLGAGGTLVGIVLAANQAVDFLFAPVAGRISDVHGRRLVLLPAMALTAVAYLAVGLAGTMAALLAIWTIAGLGSSHVLLSQAYVADITSEEHRTRGMGLWGASFALAFVIGPPAGALLFERGGLVSATVAAAVAALACVYGIIFVREPDRPSGYRAQRISALKHARALRRTVLIAIALNFAVIFIWSQFTTILPLFSADVLGWGVREYGLYLGAVGVVSALMQGALVGWLAKRVGHAVLVPAGFGLLGGGLALLAAQDGPVMLALSVFGIASGFGLLIPTLPALLSLNVRAERKGLALGVFQSASTLARVVAPLLAGIVYDELFATAPFIFSATIGLLVMVITSLPRLRNPG